MREIEWLPIDEVEIENKGDISLIRDATGTPVTDRKPVWKTNYTLIALSSERKTLCLCSLIVLSMTSRS